MIQVIRLAEYAGKLGDAFHCVPIFFRTQECVVKYALGALTSGTSGSARWSTPSGLGDLSSCGSCEHKYQ